MSYVMTRKTGGTQWGVRDVCKSRHEMGVRVCSGRVGIARVSRPNREKGQYLIFVTTPDTTEFGTGLVVVDPDQREYSEA